MLNRCKVKSRFIERFVEFQHCLSRAVSPQVFSLRCFRFAVIKLWSSLQGSLGPNSQSKHHKGGSIVRCVHLVLALVLFSTRWRFRSCSNLTTVRELSIS